MTAQQFPNLWPKVSERQVEPGWYPLLVAQANYLKAATQGAIEGFIPQMTSEWSGDGIAPEFGSTYIFYFRVPALDNYLYQLFSMRQIAPEAPYPAVRTIGEDVGAEVRSSLEQQKIFIQGTGVRIESEKQLQEVLKEVFASSKPQRVIGNLLGQVQSLKAS